MSSNFHLFVARGKGGGGTALTLMARYRIGELKSGDVSILIAFLGKIGFSPNERGKMNLPVDANN